MSSLETYLATDYLEDLRDIAALRRSLRDVANTFARTSTERGWPYKIPGKPPAVVSHGTVAMIVTALGRMIGRCALDGGAYFRFVKEEQKGSGQDEMSIASAWIEGLKLLKIEATNESDQKAKRPRKLVRLKSRTFGDNNPLTLSHVAELWRSLDDEARSRHDDALVELMKDARALLDNMLKENSDLYRTDLLKPDGSKTYYTNAFVPVRALRTATAFGLAPNLTGFRRFFESTLHDQLSFSNIPDSRFDPAELVFCLEGLLLCAPQAVDSALFRRVIDVLAEKQNTSAHWRPSKPFMGRDTGEIILPLSVEAANSLMRSVTIMDRQRYYDTHTAHIVPLLRRFWRWLGARATRIITEDKKELFGWHSEHVNQPDIIHPWDTSQVAEFMMGYLGLLERHGANETLRLSRLTVRDPSNLDIDPKQRENHALENWKKSAQKLDPSLAACRT